MCSVVNFYNIKLTNGTDENHHILTQAVEILKLVSWINLMNALAEKNRTYFPLFSSVILFQCSHINLRIFQNMKYSRYILINVFKKTDYIEVFRIWFLGTYLKSLKKKTLFFCNIFFAILVTFLRILKRRVLIMIYFLVFPTWNIFRVTRWKWKYCVCNTHWSESIDWTSYLQL